MGKISLTEMEIDEILKKNEMKIKSDIKWNSRNNQNHYKFRIPVLTDNKKIKGNLFLVGTKNKESPSYSFSLLFEKERIRGLDPYQNNNHIFYLSGKKYKSRGLHKHKYTDEIQDNYSYRPKDITDPDNVEKTFHEFLKECNIKFEGNFENPPIIQYSMPV